MSDPMLTLTLSPARRWFGLAMTGGLAAMAAAVLALQPPQSPWAILLLVVVLVVAGRQAWGMYAAASRAILMYEDRLTDESGRDLARFEDVVRIERGLFAFKPSNGFLLVLNERAKRESVPGLWWRLGRRLGVGGAAHAQTAKNMADAIQTMIAIRDEAA